MPTASRKASAAAIVVSAVSGPFTTSTSGIRSAGEKKCSPRKRSGARKVLPRPAMASPDVLEATIASGAAPSILDRTSVLSDRSSATHSITNAQPAIPSRVRIEALTRNKMAASLSASSRPRATCRRSEAASLSRPASAASAVRPHSATSIPAAPSACVIPRPIRPGPTTPTRRGSESAMECDGMVDMRAADARSVRLHVWIFVAEGNAEKQLVVWGHAQVLTDDVWKKSKRALRAGRDAPRRQRQHQRLRVHADVGRLARVEGLGHEDEDGMRSVEESVIADVSHLPPDEIAPLNTHRAIKLLRGIDLPLAMDAAELALCRPVRPDRFVAHAGRHQRLPKFLQFGARYDMRRPRLHIAVRRRKLR